MKNYNKLLLRYFTPYFIVAGLLLCTVGASVEIASNTKPKTFKTFNAIDYLLASLMVVVLLYFLYFYAVKIPLEMRKKIRRIADRYLEYAITQNPELVKIANKQFMNGIGNIIFNELSKEETDIILKTIKEYDSKSANQIYDEKVLNQELEDKILQILKKHSLLDTNFNQNILNNTLLYTQARESR